jgi:hypothetical protein
MSELTKEYFEEIITRLATKEDLSGLVTLEAFDQRLLELPTKQDYIALNEKIDDIQEKVTRIDTRTDEDTRAAYKDIVKLRERLIALEQKVKSL